MKKGAVARQAKLAATCLWRTGERIGPEQLFSAIVLFMLFCKIDKVFKNVWQQEGQKLRFQVGD